jgi:hypothetical protein
MKMYAAIASVCVTNGKRIRKPIENQNQYTLKRKAS